MADLKDLDTLPLDPNTVYLPEAQEKYRKAVEISLKDLPVINGVIDLDSIWLECALPKELIVEVFRTSEVRLPDNVEQVVDSQGRVLAERRKPSGEELAL
jgi:hypothetical protein